MAMVKNVTIVPMPQAQADKLIARVAQPLPRHYNGQGYVPDSTSALPTSALPSHICRLGLPRRAARPSDFIPLSDGDFMASFQGLWEAHVEFGTTRSHKKLQGKRRREDAPPTSTSTGAPVPKKAKAALHAVDSTTSALAATGAAMAGKLSQAASKASSISRGTEAPKAQVLANKARFGSTLAARLLGGGGGGT